MPKQSAAEAFNAHRERLSRFIRSRIRRLEDAEDILQEVFYQFTRMNERADPVERTSAWLYRAARNKIIDLNRKKKDASFSASYDEEGDEYIFDEVADVLYGTEITPETEALRSLVLGKIQAALDELPEEQRVVFELTEIAGLPVKEIAGKTGVPVNTLLSRKHYAVKRLRRSLAELYADVMGAAVDSARGGPLAAVP
ncbi:MAG: sigma-70 family RNA polymerase sigma factor [Treponema sp.]|jgi:RNA polymerase sigma factor (sigma-70 family)|nr:sigma-70 family RNA polymerase sigma factor [Treponema sp.]